jgi:hypothetical protein
VDNYPRKDDKLWSEAFAYSVYVNLQIRSPRYRKAENLLRKSFPNISMRRLDHVLDSMIISRSFTSCSSLEKVYLSDFKGLLAYVDVMRIKPVRPEFLPIELDGYTDNRLIWGIENQNFDSLSQLFDAPAVYKQINPTLQKLGKDLASKDIKEGIQFERPGADSSNVERITFLWNGKTPLGQVRLKYLHHDFYAKIETIEYIPGDKVVMAPISKLGVKK